MTFGLKKLKQTGTKKRAKVFVFLICGERGGGGGGRVRHFGPVVVFKYCCLN